MDKARMRKAAWLSAAGTLAAATATVAVPGSAHAGIINGCGNNLNPNGAGSPHNVESKAKSQPRAEVYPALYLRSGTYNGSQETWAKAGSAHLGHVALEFYKSKNSNTHYKCSITTSYVDARTYTQGTLYGWGNLAYVFRPCENVSSPAADAGNQYDVSPWVCAGWVSG